MRRHAGADVTDAFQANQLTDRLNAFTGHALRTVDTISKGPIAGAWELFSEPRVCCRLLREQIIRQFVYRADRYCAFILGGIRTRA